jgi:hypothetical protein
MERPLLNDADAYPEDAVLAAVLGSCYSAYQELVRALPDYQIAFEWRYYRDSKCWLGKAVSKKKTVFWLSVWPGFFKLSFFFTEKTRQGVQSLPVAEELKTRLENEPVKGKLVGLALEISESTQLKDAFTMISYKQSCG